VALSGGAVQRRFAGGGQAVGVHAEREQNADESPWPVEGEVRGNVFGRRRGKGRGVTCGCAQMQAGVASGRRGVQIGAREQAASERRSGLRRLPSDSAANAACSTRQRPPLSSRDASQPPLSSAAATCNAVFSSLFSGFGSAPESSSAATMSPWPSLQRDYALYGTEKRYMVTRSKHEAG